MDILDLTLALKAEVDSLETRIRLPWPLAFKSVIIRGTLAPELFHPFSYNLCPDTLRSLTVCVGVPRYIEWLGTLLNGAGQNLEHLRLSLYNMGRYRWQGMPLFVSPLRLDTDIY